MQSPRPHVLPRDAAHASWRIPAPLRTTARAFAEALFATEAGPPPAARVAWLLDDVEDFLGRAGGRSQAIFSASMLALTTLAPLTIGAAPPLARLGWRDRVRAVERFEQTPLGLAVLGAKAMLCFVWYEHPDSAGEIGYDGGCLDAGGAR
ncbi:MAG: hypothetical protein KF901_18040 [Myxococcales bacterium]|nr:hypothetical protein [Myxococcales bacterium]